MEPKCGVCTFYEKLDRAFAKDFGRCHRFPPTPNKTTMVKRNDYCGEFDYKVGREDVKKADDA